jgi:hypothetical protein
MAATPSGRGYWLLASDGGVFAFGDAPFAGAAAGAATPAQPRAVGMAATPTGRGYRIARSDGSVAAFGDDALLGPVPAGALASIVGVIR